MYGEIKLSKLTKSTVDDALLDQLDGISSEYVGEQPSKYSSRQSMLRSICNALQSDFVCGIYGNGATFLKENLRIFLKAHGFSYKIAMLEVSQNPNLQEIRDGIIQQIQQGWIDNCILILDGFWWELNDEDFKAIGIPSPSESFKIIFTSKNDDMCKHIESEHIFHINFLEDEEAWDLFLEKAGESMVLYDLHETARKIVDECDGYRIAILTIASTLKDKPKSVWERTLRKLRHSKTRPHISDMEKVFSMIGVSYDLLSDKEKRFFFCLCCLFPEDFNIPVEDLVLFAKGQQLFENVDSMRAARDRVECIIRELKDSFFLLDGDDDDFVKVHDMCRDFGVWISSQWIYPYVVRCDNSKNKWPLDGFNTQNYKGISFMCETIEQHPIHLQCPKLELLQLSFGSDSARLPKGIFKELKNLKVLSLRIPSLLQSLTTLKNLRTLCITESTLDNRYQKPRPRIGDLLGDEMVNLEIFSFSTARPYDDFPKEIGLLHNLRYLRFNRERLKYIPPDVLSKLTKLEELYLPQDFNSWGCKDEGGERMNASLTEIESLQLTTLKIGVSKGSLLGEKLVRNLMRFHLFIGSHVSPEYEFGICGNSKRSLEVFDIDADNFRVTWISDLVWKSESLRLKQVRNLKSIITWQQKEDGNIEFPHWKKICISDCKELEYIGEGQIPGTFFSRVKTLKLFGLHNLKEIWNGLYLSKIEGSCFSNLFEIQIMFCRKLKFVLLVSMATELSQLQSLQICFCDEMEAIFHREGNQGSSSIHRKVKVISSTPKSMIKGLFGRGKQQEIVTSSQQIKENIGKEGEKRAAKNAIIFRRLKTMEFAYMNNLRVFYDGNHPILLPSLESLSIFQCNHLEYFCHGVFETPLLEQIRINGHQHSVTEDLNAILKKLNC